MKKVMFNIVALLVMSSQVFADTYVGVYGNMYDTSSNTAGSLSNSQATLSFGQSTDGKVGVGYEAFFNRDGLGGIVEAFTKVAGYKVSFGAVAMPEGANRTPVANWPVASSNSEGTGAYIGLSKNIGGNKDISVKYFQYDVDHTFTSSKCTSNCGTSSAVFTSKTGKGSASRNQLWVGITFHL